MKIESGKLDQRLALYAPTITKGRGGQVSQAWSQIATLFAQRLELRTVDASRAGQRDTYAMGRFLIRWRRDLTTAHRLAHDGETYDILAIDHLPRRAGIIITVEQATLEPIEAL